MQGMPGPLGGALTEHIMRLSGDYPAGGTTARLGLGKVPRHRRQVDYGSYKDGSYIFKDKAGYYIVRHLKSQKTDVKRHLKSLANIVEKGAKERKAAKERR
jgi:hypothetical protein